MLDEDSLLLSAVESSFVELSTDVLSGLFQQAPCEVVSPPHPAVERAREILWEQAEQQISLATLAAHSGLSLYELVRQFKAACGMPPHAWQIQARIAKAKKLLRAGVRAGQAALATGFSDQAHLTRTFRRTVGTTPARYARSFRKIVQDDSAGVP